MSSDYFVVSGVAVGRLRQFDWCRVQGDWDVRGDLRSTGASVDKNMVRFVVSLAITPGKFNAFEKTMKEMTAGTEGEAGTLEYDWFLSADRSKCRLVENYVDAKAMVAHMTGPVVQVLVPKLLESGTLTGFEVYGDPGAEAREMFAPLGVEFFAAWGGVTR